MHIVTLGSSSVRVSLLTTLLVSLGLTFTLFLGGCGGGEDGGIPGSVGGGPGLGGSNPVGGPASVSLAWDPSSDPSVYAYFVYYGKGSRGNSGKCHYSYSTYVTSPSATITGLDSDTHYHFAVSAYNGAESDCSNEVSTVTPSAA